MDPVANEQHPHNRNQQYYNHHHHCYSQHHRRHHNNHNKKHPNRHYHHQDYHHWLYYYCIWLMISFVAAFKNDDLLDFEIRKMNPFNQMNSTYLDKDTNLAGIDVPNSMRITNHFNEENTQNYLKTPSRKKDAARMNPFVWREKVLRKTLTKSLTNKSLKQKFVEVMPILRVLSKQQRLALSALISAQLHEKKGHELKLEQVTLLLYY